VGVGVRAGAPALEAYPIDTAVPNHTRNLFPGVASTFAAHGFRVMIACKPDRPIMRKQLSTAKWCGRRSAKPGRVPVAGVRVW
jgi:hypothetical protein